jgi:hypothetical protein
LPPNPRWGPACPQTPQPGGWTPRTPQRGYPPSALPRVEECTYFWGVNTSWGIDTTKSKGPLHQEDNQAPQPTEIYGKRDKLPIGLGDIIQLWTTLLHLGSLLRSVAVIKPISHVVSPTLEVDFELRFSTIRLYENLLPSLQTLRASHKKLITILESRKVVPYPSAKFSLV